MPRGSAAGAACARCTVVGIGPLLGATFLYSLLPDLPGARDTLVAARPGSHRRALVVVRARDDTAAGMGHALGARSLAGAAIRTSVATRYQTIRAVIVIASPVDVTSIIAASFFVSAAIRLPVGMAAVIVGAPVTTMIVIMRTRNDDRSSRSYVDRRGAIARRVVVRPVDVIAIRDDDPRRRLDVITGAHLGRIRITVDCAARHGQRRSNRDPSAECADFQIHRKILWQALLTP